MPARKPSREVLRKVKIVRDALAAGMSYTQLMAEASKSVTGKPSERAMALADWQEACDYVKRRP